VPDETFAGFRDWVAAKLILAHEKRPAAARRIQSWTGLALAVPESEKARARYADYPLYADTKLDELWGAMFGKK
jgi:hypothetical protein